MPSRKLSRIPEKANHPESQVPVIYRQVTAGLRSTLSGCDSRLNQQPFEKILNVQVTRPTPKVNNIQSSAQCPAHTEQVVPLPL